MKKILFISLITCYSAVIISVDKQARRRDWQRRCDNALRYENRKPYRTNFSGGKSRKIDYDGRDYDGCDFKKGVRASDIAALCASTQLVAPHRTINVVSRKIKQEQEKVK